MTTKRTTSTPRTNRAKKDAVGGPPTFVQPNPDGPSLEEVLADIDRLDADADLIEDMDGDGSDFEDEPVRLQGTPDEDIDELVDWQMHNSPARRAQDRGGNTRPARARTSHASCTHATAGEAGKKARAACRKARAAASAAA